MPIIGDSFTAFGIPKNHSPSFGVLCPCEEHSKFLIPFLLHDIREFQRITSVTTNQRQLLADSRLIYYYSTGDQRFYTPPIPHARCDCDTDMKTPTPIMKRFCWFHGRSSKIPATLRTLDPTSAYFGVVVCSHDCAEIFYGVSFDDKISDHDLKIGRLVKWPVPIIPMRFSEERDYSDYDDDYYPPYH